MPAGRTTADMVALHGRNFVLGRWYEYGDDHLPAQFLGVIHSMTDNVKFRHAVPGRFRLRICTVEEWVDQAGDEVAAPEGS